MKQKKLSLLLTLIFIFSLTFNVFAAENNLKPEPQIYGKAAITIDMESGEIIYTKGIDNRMYPASTTKLITALLLAENKSKLDKLTYTQGAKAQPTTSLNTNLHPIDVGETMSAADVMDGLLIYSGNDMAYVIADNVGKDEKDFANKMNDKISKLGLKNTHFITPNGLHDPNHYTTPYDLSIIARTSFKNDWVRETIAKQKSTIKTSKGTTFIIDNTNKLLGKDGCIGGKTGYTDAAGRCLVAIYERNGKKILGVVMSSIYDKNDTFVFDDMKKIIDWSFEAKPTTLHPKDSVFTTKTIKYRPLGFIGPERSITVPIIVKEDVNYYDNQVNKNELKEDITLTNMNLSSLNNNNPIGTLTLKERDSSKEYKLYTTISRGSVIKNNLPIYGAAAAIVLTTLAVVGFIVKKILDAKRRKRRGKYI